MYPLIGGGQEAGAQTFNGNPPVSRPPHEMSTQTIPLNASVVLDYTVAATFGLLPGDSITLTLPFFGGTAGPIDPAPSAVAYCKDASFAASFANPGSVHAQLTFVANSTIPKPLMCALRVLQAAGLRAPVATQLSNLPSRTVAVGAGGTTIVPTEAIPSSPAIGSSIVVTDCTAFSTYNSQMTCHNMIDDRGIHTSWGPNHGNRHTFSSRWLAFDFGGVPYTVSRIVVEGGAFNRNRCFLRNL